MSMQFIDVTGKTENEAIENALGRLGLDRDDVSVEILERAKSGFLGLGASPAKVRVTYEVPDEPAPAPETPEPVKKPEAAEPAKKPERRPQADRKPPRRERPEKPQEKPAPKKPEEPPIPAPEEEPAETAAPVPLGEEVFDEKSQQIRSFLDGLMTHMDSEGKQPNTLR